jgi:hypothetical protein
VTGGAVTDRHCGYVVALDHDVREDDAAVIIAAIKMIKGVVDVRPVVGDHFEMTIERMRLRREIYAEIRDIVTEKTQ